MRKSNANTKDMVYKGVVRLTDVTDIQAGIERLAVRLWHTISDDYNKPLSASRVTKKVRLQNNANSRT